MAKAINLRQAQSAVGMQREWAYSAIDVIATREVHDALVARNDAVADRTLDFYMAAQGPALEMTLRGLLVDEVKREGLKDKLRKEAATLKRGLAKRPEITSVWDKMEKETGACHNPSRKDGKHKWEPGVPDTSERKCVDCGRSRMKIRPFKPSSDADLQHLFYDLLKMKPQLNKDGKVTSDKEARERLKNKYPKWEPLIEEINKLADTEKKLQFLEFRASPDGRFKAGFNVGVTNTGRWSSNKNPFGEGSNAQNITEELRSIFIPDDGYELCYADLKQAESNVIAHEGADENYIEAHVIGDTHTYVCRLVWPEGIDGQPWTGDIKQDKTIATSARPKWDDKPGHDFRFQSKAIQHGSNLGLSAFGIAIKRHIPVQAARDAQGRYFKAFPGVRAYQRDIRQKVENQEPIVNALGVRFRPMGRPWDDATVRQGLSIKPQSTVGHVISIGIWRIWVEIPEIQLLAQVHDAVLFQFPKGRYNLVHRAINAMRVPVPIRGVDGIIRTTVIETEAAVGMNWGHHSDDNPDGLREIVFKSETEWSKK